MVMDATVSVLCGPSRLRSVNSAACQVLPGMVDDVDGVQDGFSDIASPASVMDDGCCSPRLCTPRGDPQIITTRVGGCSISLWWMPLKYWCGIRIVCSSRYFNMFYHGCPDPFARDV